LAEYLAAHVLGIKRQIKKAIISFAGRHERGEAKMEAEEDCSLQ